MESTPVVGMAELSQNPGRPYAGAPYWLGSLLFGIALLILLRVKPYGLKHV